MGDLLTAGVVLGLIALAVRNIVRGTRDLRRLRRQIEENDRRIAAMQADHDRAMREYLALYEQAVRSAPAPRHRITWVPEMDEEIRDA